MIARIPNWVLASGLALIFALGIFQLIAARMDEGDVYPPYSTFRADPLGAKAIYLALQNLPGRPLTVERHFRRLDRLVREPDGRTNDLHKTLLVLLGEEPRSWSWNPPKERLEAIEQAARAGATVLIAFKAIETVPTIPTQEPPPPGKSDKPEGAPAPADRRARTEPPSPTPTPSADEDEKGKSPGEMIEEMKRNYLRRDVNLGDRWGLDIRREKKPEKKDAKTVDKSETAPAERLDLPAYPAFPAETGKDSLPWHSALDFEIAPSEQPLWRVMYSRSRRPVLAVRDFGAGKLILASDTFFVSNEALFKDANPAALAWLLGDARRVVFDEQMHGTRDDPGLMTFVNRYRLTGAVFAILLLALLYVWMNTAPLVPPPPDPGAEGAPPQEGLAAEAGLPSLLRRAVAPSQLPRLCFDQWQHAAGGLDGRARPTPERAARLRAILSAPGAEKDPAATYRAMRDALRPSHESQNHPT